MKLLSQRLSQMLGNYERVAQLKIEGKPVFSHYSHFEEILHSFAHASCSGCRGDNVQCLVVGCSAESCYREKGVAYCFQCDEYPCDRQFTSTLRERWKERNDRMREIGVIEYYHEQIGYHCTYR
ncbi:MAG: DUF3795 domain-containing protein [Peptococcaceae bacterium]|nr:DUF3795 domain-containing protein [Peptococcaceae bacterium]